MEKQWITGTWNYLESGHGNGIPDGIGAVGMKTVNKVPCNTEWKGRRISKSLWRRYKHEQMKLM